MNYLIHSIKSVIFLANAVIWWLFGAFVIIYVGLLV